MVVTGTNDLPVAHPDTNQTDDQHRIEVAADNGLLSNDTDKDTSDSLQVYSLSSGDTVVSPDESIRGDEGGTFIVAADGSYQFLLGEDFFNLQQGDNVTTSIQYTVVDEFGGTSSNTLSISVAGIANSNTQREFQGESYPSSNSYSSSITINEAPESNTGRDEIAPETVSSSTPLVLGSNGNESSSQSQASKSTPGVSATSVGVSDTQITNNTNRVINNVALGLTEEAGASLDQTLSQPGETSINARSAFDLGTGREDSSAALRDNIPQPDQRLLLDSESNQHEREISNSATKTKQQISIGYEPILISNFLEYQSVLNDQESENEEKLSRQRLLELGSAFGVSAGISLGYAVWVMRSGILLSSLLGSLPIWRFIDPLQVLPVGRSQSEDHEDESLASIASGDNEKAVKNESTPDPEGISNSTDTRT